jgi:sulfur carrier protein
MQIDVNGAPHAITAITATDVAGALAELGWGEARVATALNGSFVPAAARATTALANGDRLEVLTAMQGG